MGANGWVRKWCNVWAVWCLLLGTRRPSWFRGLDRIVTGLSAKSLERDSGLTGEGLLLLLR